MDFKKTLKKYFLPLMLALTLIVVPVSAFADQSAVKCSGASSTGDVANDPRITNQFPVKFCGANSLIVAVISVLLGIAGLIAVLFIVIGGYRYLTSNGNEEGAKAGRAILTNAVIGLVIIILGYTIVTIVAKTLQSASDSANPGTTAPSTSVPNTVIPGSTSLAHTQAKA